MLTKFINKLKTTTIVPFFIIPFLAALLSILKIFFNHSCLAFDSTDDANHTFVNFFIFKSILQNGAIPLINLYNNFGTPLLGDAVTFPLAPHGLIYWFLPYDLAMTINRFVIAFLTIAILTFYFRKYMSAASASVSSLLVMFAPCFFWCFSTHHYQTVLLYFTILLILQERLVNTTRFTDFLYLFITMICFMLSNNINLIVLALFFLMLKHALELKFKFYPRILLL